MFIYILGLPFLISPEVFQDDRPTLTAEEIFRALFSAGLVHACSRMTVQQASHLRDVPIAHQLKSTICSLGILFCTFLFNLCVVIKQLHLEIVEQSVFAFLIEHSNKDVFTLLGF